MIANLLMALILIAFALIFLYFAVTGLSENKKVQKG